MRREETKLPEKSSRRFLADTNLFIAAVKEGWSRSTDLVLKLITEPSIELVANEALLAEYEKYARKLDSKYFLTLLKSRVNVETPSLKCIEKSKPYLHGKADTIHAATCFSTGATLITNDDDFNEIAEKRIINVWSISKAIKKLL